MNTNTFKATKLAFLHLGATVAALLCFTVNAHAQFILSQAEGADYLAFEAEDVWEIVSGDDATGWNIVGVENPLGTDFGTDVLSMDTNAAQQRAIFDVNGGSDQDYVGYKLQFVEPGDYHLYLRYSFFERGDNASSYGNENSFYASSDFGTDGLDGTDADPRGPRDDTPSLYFSIPNGGRSALNGDFEGQYEWWNPETDASDADGIASNPDAVYTPELNTTLDFGFAARERHVSIDRVVFHTNGELEPEELDALLSFAPGTGTPGDYNDDGSVNFADFLTMAENFNDRFPIADSFAKGDENRDGLVDISDFVLFRPLLTAAGEPNPSAVPEPSSWILLGGILSTIGWWRKRRRGEH